MAYTLPPIQPDTLLSIHHFPNRCACFIYRNWELISPETMAAVLDTTPENVLALAEKMGLPTPPDVHPDWLRRGYITLIRNNWALISYRQMCLMLGWSEDELAYTLKEDDFLSIKLGRFKHDTGELTWSAPASEEEEWYNRIRRATESFYARVSARTVQPFDFCTMFSRLSKEASGKPSDTLRIVYSYCALYGDTFTADFDDSFPEELLAAYQAAGVNGVWCQAVLYKLVPFPFRPALSEGWEARLEGLNRLIDRLAKYGLKLYLYLNEPRSMPEEFFDQYPQLKGVPGEGFYTMCTSTPEVQKYLYDSAALIAARAPGLGGFLTITASENFTSCYSHYSEANCPCPRCSKRRRPEVIAEVNNLLYRGAASANPNFRHIAWSWGWEKGHIPDIIDAMDPGITVMGVSEQAVEKKIGDAVTSVIDYSISVVGPGEYALSTWQHAKAAGHPALAKIQLNNTWECPSVPFIPAFELVYRHLCGIADAGVDGIMLGWTLGGYPSPTMFMLRELMDSPQRPTLRQLYETVFPKEAAALVEQACHAFSEAFDQYPFNIGTAYSGPQNMGSANLLYLTCSNFAATMTCYPYDHLDSWRSIFSRETFSAQLDKMAARWEEGLDILSALPDELVKNSAALSDLVDSAQACGYTFASMANQTHFVLERIGNADPDILADLTRREAELAIRTANVCARNPLIGYESSNHYFYTRSMLAEKAVNCAEILHQLGKEQD